MEEVGASRVEVGNPKMVIGFVLTRKCHLNWDGMFHVCFTITAQPGESLCVPGPVAT